MEDPGPHLYNLLLSFPASLYYGNLNIELLTGIVLVIILLLLSAASSASELSFFSLTQSELDSLKKKESQKSRLILILLENPKRLMATILVTNIVINISLVVVLSILLNSLFGISISTPGGAFLDILIIAAIILLFGEIMPKIYAGRNSMRVSCLTARFIFMAHQVFYPLSSILVNSTNIVERKIAHKGHNITMDELSEALELSQSQGDEPDEERKILKGIIKFGDIAVREIMKPRVDVTAADDTSTFDELLNLINESGYSRIPIYKENLDNITGILYIKDLIPHIHQNAQFEWQILQRPAFFVPENKRINDLLQEFQSKKIHLAIVVDEYGGTSGIITLEDILEEIVGEINDEFDSEVDQVLFNKLDDENYIFEGKTLLNDFCKVIGVDDRIFQDIKGESDTLAGLVLEMAGRIPETGESFEFDDFTFKPELVDKRSIKRIRVTIKPNKQESN